ncbi:MAG: hypothetical protein CME98_07985 [Hyphomonas sp.]|nr:hypothetical protein [Hyphomonas sp.]
MRCVRQILISTNVFAMIWSVRQSGEESEDQILRRILADFVSDPRANLKNEQTVGIMDRRNEVHFSEGFEVFRNMAGKEVCAVVQGGEWWIKGTQTRAASLNGLSRALSRNNENAWQVWFYLDDHGKRVPVSSLRPRKKRSLSRGDRPMMEKSRPTLPTVRWCDDVREALRVLGGTARLDDIYVTVEKQRSQAGRSTPTSLPAVVRKELEQRSSDSEAFLGGDDWFKIAGEKGEGIWSLRFHSD